ncbi:hypothetical protein NKT77_09880 [Moraxella sp. FZLJ2107]|uniref:hypothetical protein n=1 Tax=unclassified Moraxella TaxID=2685852 RepID=UPI0020C8F586|nr:MULTISPECIES: hypothetical protein [unclassified Moraxella]UTO04796.1 hypothetical protein NKT77_09880 [Moraxella sp. FZLJ2107]UTO21528.1 hypothetical protein NKU06_06685 [Moraxella sp. FZLJ2109]
MNQINPTVEIEKAHQIVLQAMLQLGFVSQDIQNATLDMAERPVPENLDELDIMLMIHALKERIKDFQSALAMVEKGLKFPFEKMAQVRQSTYLPRQLEKRQAQTADDQTANDEE